MGNRANAVFKQDGGYLGLYMHNGGYDHKKNLALALQRVVNAGRVSDVGYATRIAVSDMIGTDWSQDLSYGLYVGATMHEVITDNENDIIVVDWDREIVSVYNYYRIDLNLKGVNEYTIREFIDAHKGDKG